MAFNKQTWPDRQVEFPGRRKLTPTGATDEFDVIRSEGQIITEGKAFDAANMNDLEDRIEAEFNKKLDKTGTAADSEKLAGALPDADPTADTIVKRGTSGEIFGYSFKQTFANLNATVGNIITQISSADGYFRPTSPAQFIAALKLLTKDNYGNPISLSGSFTLNASQENSKVYMSNASAAVITIPPNLSIGYELWVKRMGQGTITFATGSGVTLYSIGTKRSIREVYGSAALTHQGNNVWTLDGSLE